MKQEQVVNTAKYEVPAPQFLPYDVGLQIGAALWLTENVYLNLAATSSVFPTRPNPSITNVLSFYEKGNYNQTIQFTLGIRFGKKAEV